MLTRIKWTTKWWSNLDLWGSGHTLATDPTHLGWKAKGVRGKPGLLLIGRPGCPGCASVRRLPGGELDVALYAETPCEVAASIAAGDALDARYMSVKCVSGWAMDVIRALAAEMSHGL